MTLSEQEIAEAWEKGMRRAREEYNANVTRALSKTSISRAAIHVTTTREFVTADPFDVYNEHGERSHTASRIRVETTTHADGSLNHRVYVFGIALTKKGTQDGRPTDGTP